MICHQLDTANVLSLPIIILALSPFPVSFSPYSSSINWSTAESGYLGSIVSFICFPYSMSSILAYKRVEEKIRGHRESRTNSRNQFCYCGSDLGTQAWFLKLFNQDYSIRVHTSGFLDHLQTVQIFLCGLCRAYSINSSKCSVDTFGCLTLENFS